MAKHESTINSEGLVDILNETGMAWLGIDMRSDRVEGCNPAAASLLGVDESALSGQPWAAVLCRKTNPDAVLLQALRAGVRCTLAPVIIRRPDALELVVGGMVVPERSGATDRVNLLLRPLHDAFESRLVDVLTDTDTVAVLGVDQLEHQQRWSGADTTRMMMDVRASLLDILRTKDEVGLPVGTALTLVLRDIDISGARDISRALLSHLHSIPQSPGVNASNLRLRVGLAQMSADTGPLGALLGANRALMQAQHDSGLEPIRAADGSDAAVIAGHMINANGVFSDNRPAPPQREYLARLISLVAGNGDADTLMGAVVQLTLEQAGVVALAIYQRRSDRAFDYVAGGFADESGARAVPEDQLPRAFRDGRRRIDSDYLEQGDRISQGQSGLVVLPLRGRDNILGYLGVQHAASSASTEPGFAPDAAAMYTLATALSGMKGWRDSPAASMKKPPPVVTPMETGIDGYVGDNMEGAVDQAIFLSKLDVPIAIIGSRGTGKMYVAKIIHQESGAAPDMLVEIDCREFHSRKQADTRIVRELRQAEGKTLVFKSPQLMNADAQIKLARQVSTRTLADVSPLQYLPRVKLIALFPDNMDKLIRQERLTQQLASAFAGYPINVPPIKDRKQAVLRWAHKLLGQECALRERYVRGFTPDAEQAMLRHDWPGNISEMRQCIVDALDKTDKEWITPVDLGIFKGISPDGVPFLPEAKPFLAVTQEDSAQNDDAYAPSAFEALDVALGEAVNNLLALNSNKPLGAWLDDEVVLAVCDRYGSDMRGAAEFLHTKPRNISRWLPKIQSREEKRHSSILWQDSRRLVKEWIRESAQLSESPLHLAQAMLLAHVSKQGHSISVAERARIMGVSTPTYQKRLQEIRGG